MAELETGGPAFPGGLASSPLLDDGVQVPYRAGMSLRDYFAAAVLSGPLLVHIHGERRVAELAYVFADEMLRARG